MDKRVLVLGAGTGASNNLIRSLKAGDPSLVIVGTNDDRFVLKKSIADRHYLTTKPHHPRFGDALCRLVELERIDVVIPGSDADAAVLSDIRDRLSGRLLLPQKRTIQLCQDKYELTQFLRANGVAAPATVAVGSLDDLSDIFGQLGDQERLWCRIRTGTGSMGATAVRSVEQARAWISYWEDMRGVAATLFTLSEYLPGRDFACQSVWKNGAVFAIRCCERLAYYGGAHRASGVSSTPSLAKTVRDQRIVDVCIEAIRAIDDDATGVFAVDLKENREGLPCVTEINAGRFFMITNIFDLTGAVNLATLYIQLACDEPVAPRLNDDGGEYYLVRDLDTEPGLYPVDDLFTDIQEIRI
jgi:glutathione synthase/RimK-type ligase-like ATP-grasp enzyme